MTEDQLNRGKKLYDSITKLSENIRLVKRSERVLVTFITGAKSIELTAGDINVPFDSLRKAATTELEKRLGEAEKEFADL